MRCWNPDCDNDHLALRAVTCPECKTDRPRTKPGASAQPERRRAIERDGHVFNVLLCQQVDRGQECAGIAVWSPSTTGGGPWFCRQHDPGRSYTSVKHDQPRGFQPISLALKQPPAA